MARLLLLAGMFLGLVFLTGAYDFYPGGRKGWVTQPGESYNHWAGRMRFQVADKLVFKYKKGDDSVLLVKKEDYDSCTTSNPIKKFDDGDTVFQFDRSGPFFFISDAPNHCSQGQKLVVVVMAVRNKPSPPPIRSPPPASPPSVSAPPVKPPSISPSPASVVQPPSSPPSPVPAVNPPSSSPSLSPAPSFEPPSPSPSSPVSPSPSPSSAPTSSPAKSPASSPSPSPSPILPSSSPPAAPSQSPPPALAPPAEVPGGGGGAGVPPPLGPSSNSTSTPSSSHGIFVPRFSNGFLALVLGAALLG